MLNTMNKLWGYRYVILIIIWILYIINYFDRMAVITFLPFIQEDMNLSPVQAGQIASIFFLAYSVGQVSAGFLADKFGAKKVMYIAIVTFTLASFLTGYVRTFSQLVALRIALGLGEAHHFAPSAKAVSSWFPYSHRGKALSFFNTSNYVGLALAPVILTGISAYFFNDQWRPVFFTLAIPGAIGIWILWAFFTNEPEEMYKKGRLKKEELDLINADQGAVLQGALTEKVSEKSKIFLKDPSFYVICFIMFCQMGILWGFTTWLSTFLVQQHGFEIKQMGLIASLPPIVSIVSILMGGWLLDKFKKMKPVALIAYLGCIPLLWIIGTIEKGNTTALVALLLLSGFFVAFNSGCITAVIQKIYPSAVVGGATGLVNGFGQLGAFLTPLIAGYLITVENNGSYDFSKVFIYFSLLAGLAAISSLFLNEKPVQVKEMNVNNMNQTIKNENYPY